MHMADALVSPAVGGTMYATSALAAGYAVRKIRLEADNKKVPLMGVTGAFVFAAQMINFTIPGTGSSGHLAGGMMLTALLGPHAAFITMIGVLLIQCLMFADGGLLALGCNVWNMAFYGCFIGGFLIWKQMMKGGVSRKKITAASVIGSMLTLQMGAFSVVLETSASGITELPFSVFVGAMQPIHLAIGLVEGLITALVINFVYEARPELIWTGQDTKNMVKPAGNDLDGRMSYKKVLGILGLAAVAVGGVLSLFASAFPDGLEWSIQKLTGSTEVAGSGSVHYLAERIQSITALLPDYAFKHSDTVAGTSFSGVVGAMLVVVLCVIVCKVIAHFSGHKNGSVSEL